MALGARPQVQLLLQSACTYVCCHIYDWNIVNCDVKNMTEISLIVTLNNQFTITILSKGVEYCLGVLLWRELQQYQMFATQETHCRSRRRVTVVNWGVTDWRQLNVVTIDGYERVQNKKGAGEMASELSMERPPINTWRTIVKNVVVRTLCFSNPRRRGMAAQQILQLNKSVPIAKLTAENNGIHAKSTDNAGGLLPTIYLCKGARVMLTCNIDVQHGVFNDSSAIPLTFST